MITIQKINDDIGLAICVDNDPNLRVDVFPSDNEDGTFTIDIREPDLTPFEAIQFSELLKIAVKVAENYNQYYKDAEY